VGWGTAKTLVLRKEKPARQEPDWHWESHALLCGRDQ